MNMYDSDWLNNEDDWPIPEQDKVRQESQTHTAGRKKGGVRSFQQIQREARRAWCTETRYQPMRHSTDKKYGLI